MVCLPLLASAAGALASEGPWAVTVQPEPVVRPLRPGPARPAVGWATHLDAAPAAPPLAPLLTGPSPPSPDLRLAVDGPHLSLRATGLPADHTLSLVVDPDGTGRGWVRVDGAAGVARWCSVPAALADHVAGLPSRAVPCGRDQAVEGVEEPDGRVTWTLTLPVPVQREARVLLTLLGPDDRGGTWAPAGKSALLPELGRPLARVGADGARLPFRPRGASSPRAPRPDPAVWTVTPFPDPRDLTLRYDLDGPTPVTVAFARPGGRVLATQAVALPAGRGAVRLTSDARWPRRGRLTVVGPEGDLTRDVGPGGPP